MEVNEIKSALIDFRSPAQKGEHSQVFDNMLIFLQKVLGYDLNEDIILEKLEPSSERPKQADFDKNIKFVMTTLPYEAPFNDASKELAIGFALAAKTNVVMLSNGVKINFYSIDNWEGKWEGEILMEINLFEDDPAEISQALWPLSKKDCHRKVRVSEPK